MERILIWGHCDVTPSVINIPPWGCFDQTQILTCWQDIQQCEHHLCIRILIYILEFWLFLRKKLILNFLKQFLKIIPTWVLTAQYFFSVSVRGLFARTFCVIALLARISSAPLSLMDTKSSSLRYTPRHFLYPQSLLTDLALSCQYSPFLAEFGLELPAVRWRTSNSCRSKTLPNFTWMRIVLLFSLWVFVIWVQILA